MFVPGPAGVNCSERADSIASKATAEGIRAMDLTNTLIGIMDVFTEDSGCDLVSTSLT